MMRVTEMSFCSNCGAEVKENAKFCDKCGTALNANNQQINTQNTTSGITCPKCGSIIPLGNTTCLNCGMPLNQESNTAAIILGYIGTILGALLFPIIGIIIGLVASIYLLTRQNKSSKIHGVIILIILLIVAGLWFSYMSYIY